ncbi:MAG: hypothetical protein AAGF12_06455 [Myxococcota bacterium]
MSEALASWETRSKVRPNGRWNGAVTQRPFPGAEEIEELDLATRRRVAEYWLGQAASEARVAESFRSIHSSLLHLQADAGLIRLAARAVDDEHRHAALTEELACRYAGRRVGPHPVLAPQQPRHERAASETLRHALFVTGQCALNETFATAYLSAARRGAESPIARHALRELLEDEIDHSRIGWAFLAEVPVRHRAELSDWLLPLTVCNYREWQQLQLPENDALAPLGIPPAEVARTALFEALEGILLPGFRHVGLDTRDLEAWIRAGAPVPGAS